MIGVFLGSFDPPHIGHLNLVSCALNEGGLEKIYVVPSLSNPWKQNQTPWGIRFQLTLEAFYRYGSKVHVSDAELKITTDPDLQKELYEEDDTTDRKTTVPSYVLLRYFRKYVGNGDDVCLITTSETFAEIINWNHGNFVFRENKFKLIYPKHFGGSEFSPQPNVEAIYPKNSIKISSTVIRDGIRNGKIMHEYLPGKVEDLINELELYRTCQD